jgi:putative toxin-antitoxin system antitoxin component (TIGR02293 family)
MWITARDVAEVLGVNQPEPVNDDLELARRLEDGLPISAVDRVSRLISPGDAGFRDRLVARATLARRRHQERLTLEEGERVERFARLWAHAVRLFKDQADARRFFATPHMLLRGQRPIDLARSGVGARAVEDVLGRLEFGSAA